MIRDALAERLPRLQGEPHFRWRGGDVSRLEGLTDAVIALALTLVMLSSEVPREAGELFELLGQLPAFACTFAVLAMIWWYHFRFHRRYGLEDFTTGVINIALLFVLLLYVYPLRFLFGMMFGGFEWPDRVEMPQLMMLYGGGYAVVFGLFWMLYRRAWKFRDALQLDASERLITRSALWAHGLHCLVGVVSFVLALLASRGFFPSWLAAFSGMVYFTIGPMQGINGWLWGRRVTQAAAAELAGST